MAREAGPFPGEPMYEVVNRRMQRTLALASRPTGFTDLSQGAVTAGTGAQLVIAAYPDGALVDGLYVENPTTETVALTTNSGSTNPRIDRLVMRLDMSAQTIAPFQIVGTPAASPSTPPLVQTATVYDMPLCRYTMPGSGSAQNPGSIVDERIRLKASDTTLGEGYLALRTTITATSTWQDLVSFSVTSTGGVCSARMDCQMFNGDTNFDRTFDVRVTVDGTEIGSLPGVLAPLANHPYVCRFATWPSTPSAGPHTYKIQTRASAAAGVVAETARLVVVEKT